MPLKNSPIAIDGALIDSATLRANTYAATQGAEGIVNSGDMKVTQLTVPGNGVSIAGGSALILNRYQDEADLNETYSVVDPGGTNLGPGDMPPAVGAPQSHLVCVTIGDPEFSQVGHPWMLVTDPPAGTEETFQYVRYFVIQNVPSSTESFEELNLNYPAYAIARLDIPASTTTITNAMIVDLREIAQPKSQLIMEVFTANSNQNIGFGVADNVHTDFPTASAHQIKIPSWATKMKVTGSLVYLAVPVAGTCWLRFNLTNVGATPQIYSSVANSDAGAFKASDRHVAGELDIPEAARGTTQTLSMQGAVGNSASIGCLSTGLGLTQGFFSVTFEQEPA